MPHGKKTPSGNPQVDLILTVISHRYTFNGFHVSPPLLFHGDGMSFMDIKQFCVLESEMDMDCRQVKAN